MISLLVVNYRAAALAAEAIRTARMSTSEQLQVVVVDNSCDEAEAAALQGVADMLVVSDTNRGYAGAINLGRPKCEGATIVVANPDVTFAAGAIDYLHAALGGRTAVAGPALFWDDAHEWHLPPADRSTSLEKLDEVLASRSRAWFEQRDRRRFRRRVAFWSLSETTHVETLSGAVMAIRAADFDDLGGFDERFRLYFEETDFLRRSIAHHRRVAYVPAA
jgi:N-acetylglucosaminyl-diphospho-decaprenol L-rhamnosyltransferase